MIPLDLAHQTGPVAVTLAYLGLYYAFQVNLLRVKADLSREYEARGEKFDRYFGQDRRMLAADRIQLNTLEHMPPFLALLWMSALFVAPLEATIAGSLYVASRAAYPLVIGPRLGRGIRSRVMVVTYTGYAVLTYLAGSLVVALVS